MITARTTSAKVPKRSLTARQLDKSVMPLWETYWKSKSIDARNAVAVAYWPWVRRVAKSVFRSEFRFYQHELCDFEQAGYGGLIYAIERWQPDKGAAFVSFATLRVRGSMMDFARQADPRGQANRRRHRSMRLVSLNHEYGETEAGASALVSAMPDESEPEASAALETEDFWRDICRGLSKKERSIVRLYYREQLTMRDIGRKMGMTQSRVSQLHSAIISKIRERLDVASDFLELHGFLVSGRA